MVEEGVFTVVSGPDGEVATPGDAALGGFPKEPGVGMLGEFVDADVAAVNGHGLRVRREGEDARAVVEFDDADFEVVGEGGGAARGVKALDFDVFFAAGDDGAGVVEEVGEVIAEAHVFECAGIIFGGEEVVAVAEVKAFADVFEGVGVGPADADGFFGEGEGLAALVVDGFFGFDPVDLVRHEVAGEGGVGVEAEWW